MNILITNDDGIEADGIRYLASALESIANITVVAPLYERSGASQSLTIHQPLYAKKIVRQGKFLGYGVNGTPADCIKLAVSKICDKKPDLVISGINRGPNNACNILYSGTVGGASEGVVLGIKSIAVSLTDYQTPDYSAACIFMQKLIKNIDMLPNDCMLYNINVPGLSYDDIKGVKFTKMSQYSYLNNYDNGTDPFGETFYWLSDFRRPEHTDKSTDDGALSEGYISITPLIIDRTDYNALNLILEKGDIWQK